MSGRPARVLCAGITVHDHVFRLDRFPPPGAKKRAQEFAAVGGGCAANAAVAIARLGGAAALASPIGGPAGLDRIGDWILDDLAREGVDCRRVVRVAGAVSPISAILVNGAGERLIVNHRDERLSDARIDDPDEALAGFDALLADNRFAPFVLPLCQAARRRGIPAVLDGDRPTTASDALLTACSHLVFAADGLRATAQCDDLAEALRAIAMRTDAFCAVTDGERGTLWLDGVALRSMPARTVAAVDTLGAGDVFHGAFVLALAEGRSEIEALGFATAASSVKCTRFGGIRGAPTRAETVAALASVDQAGQAGDDATPSRGTLSFNRGRM